MKKKLKLTYSLELILELCVMLVTGDSEVVIWICALIHSIGWIGSADSKDRSEAICPLQLPATFKINAPHLCSALLCYEAVKRGTKPWTTNLNIYFTLL